MNLNKIGEPVDILVCLNDDVLPSPEALLVTESARKKQLMRATLKRNLRGWRPNSLLKARLRLAIIACDLMMSICGICFSGIFTILTNGSGKTDARNGIFWMWCEWFARFVLTE